MNFIKKNMLLILVLTMGSINIKCMNQDQDGNSMQVQGNPTTDACRRFSTRVFESRRWDNDNTEVSTTLSIWSMGDYITQLASIYLVDTPHQNFVKRAAIMRIIFNALSNFYTAGNLLSKKRQTIAKSDLVAIASLYFRGKNFSQDKQNQKDSVVIAFSNNEERSKDESLKKKKLLQFSWLTLNKLLSYWALPLGGLKQKWIVELSELYRQKMMYQMIKNHKKAV